MGFPGAFMRHPVAIAGVALHSRLACINNPPWMNAHCLREVRSLKDRESTCRIPTIGPIGMVPALMGTAAISARDMSTNGFSYHIGQGCPPCLPCDKDGVGFLTGFIQPGDSPVRVFSGPVPVPHS